ncbi:MAG: hypothetical protein RL033_760 [Pseudomonadota bacterium]|jgi:hypothetical protein
MRARNIAEVLEILERLIAEFRGRRSRLAFFAALYRAVTLRVRLGIERGEFEDGARMDAFDTAFANRYFEALELHLAGGKPAKSWQVAFGAQGRSSVIVFQHLLLGMNAHINFDLPLAALDIAPGAALPELETDFFAINRILAGLLDPAQAALGEFSPLLHILDRLGGRVDESIGIFSLVNARDEAWHEAGRLAFEVDPRRARSVLSLDRRVAMLAERIVVPGGLFGAALELIARTESHDVPAITDRLLAMA